MLPSINAPGANPSVDVLAGMRVVDGNYKLSKNVKIAMLYLEDDDAVNAETYIKKASALISACKVKQHLAGHTTAPITCSRGCMRATRVSPGDGGHSAVQMQARTRDMTSSSSGQPSVCCAQPAQLLPR